MKRILPLILLVCFNIAYSQTVTVKVIDASNNKALAYAIVLYQQQQKVVYTDINGYFILNTDSLMKNDSVTVQFLGYQKLSIPVSGLNNNLVIRMIPQVLSLQPVIVSTCKKAEEVLLNKKVGRIKQYIGPGPETRLVIMSRYNNISGINGYVRKVSILIDEKNPNMQVPLRLRWYEWNADTHAPGKELTDTSILVYPYKEGWNDFDIPPMTIPCPKDWLVFGFEFIYTPEYKQHYDELKSNQEKIKWLSDMQNRWSLAMQYVTEPDECGFYIVNNENINSYTKKYDRYFIRPAVKFTIEVCKE